MRNLYVHVPFCRRKCAYCALYSRAAAPAATRAAYGAALAKAMAALPSDARFDTVYFGGGTPAQCDLESLLAALAPHRADNAEVTVELHPLDVTDDLLAVLADGGVTRISLGVESLDDATLERMGRGYAAADAARAFARVRSRFDNAGIDLIVGFPGDPCRGYDALASWGLVHASLYALQNERNLEGVPDDDTLLDLLNDGAAALESLGLERYEISNYAKPGYACRHNLAVWRGEDYLGLGAGACGRVGLTRTRGVFVPSEMFKTVTEMVTHEEDAKERTLFRLRTREGLDSSAFPAWRAALDRDVAAGLLTRDGTTYCLTARGREVCDAILEELV